MLSLLRVHVQPLVEELKSYELHHTVKKKKEVVYNYILYVQNTEEKLNMLNRDKKDLKKIQFKLLKIKIILNGICGRFDTAKKILVYLNIQQ